MLDYISLSYNLLTSVELKKPPTHCMMSQSIIDESGEEIALMVIDYYTPIGKPHGWWCAIRGPHYQKGKHPKHIIFIKEGLETPSMDQVIACQHTIENMIKTKLIDFRN